MSSITRRKGTIRRNRMFAQSPHCHWCQVLTHKGGEMDDTRSTLDHIKCRAECATAIEYHVLSNTVLSCLACNVRRNEEYLLSHVPTYRCRRYCAMPRKVNERMPTAFDRPVAAWRY